MRSRDPALVVGLGTRSDSGAVSANNSDLVGWVDLLRSARRALGTFAAFAAALLLGEERSDPGVVDEVDGSAENAEEDEVKENAEIAC